MPNQEIMREWVDALRSGQYRQTEQRLRNDNGFCCLGVLCELAVQKGVIQPGMRSDSKMFNPEDRWGAPIHVRTGEYIYDGSITQPSVRVLDWSGIAIVNKPGQVGLTGAKLAELNDDGVPFSQIADLIEHHWIEPEVKPEPEVEIVVPDNAAELTGELAAV